MYVELGDGSSTGVVEVEGEEEGRKEGGAWKIRELQETNTAKALRTEILQ